MGYRVTHWTGEMERDWPREKLESLIDELASADAEHPDVAVTHESEWCLTVLRSGFVVLEHLEEGEPKHLGPVDRRTALELMSAVADGRIDELSSRPWKPGYPAR